MRDLPVPKHNAVSRRWLEFPRRRIDFSDYFDVRNAQSLWLELSNLVRDIEHSLDIAQAFERLEPAQEPPLEDDDAISDLYFIHERKMATLDSSVYEPLAAREPRRRSRRQYHAELGENAAHRSNVENGLQAKYAAGAISKSNFDAITAALRIPKDTPYGDVAITYRRKLMHHIKPSVDYSIFFSGLDSREGEEVTNARGDVVGRRHVIRSRPPVQYRFADLHAPSKFCVATVRPESCSCTRGDERWVRVSGRSSYACGLARR